MTDPSRYNGKGFEQAYSLCSEYTITPEGRMLALYQAVKRIIQDGIPGDFVECGVYEGGSTMLIACALLELNVTDRKIYLYDTFEGMTKPTEHDYRRSKKGKSAIKKWEANKKWCYASLPDVRNHMALTGYPEANMIFIEGKVEDTIPKTMPSEIAILRLDTDWYESTKHELIHMFPLLVKKGILILDDYGHWAGAKKAVDEYFLVNKISLEVIDSSAMIGVKE